MRTFILSVVGLGGLVIASAMPAAATTVAVVPDGIHAGPSASIQTVDYYYNHHHYHHRSWDRHHHRWHYY